MIFNEFYRVGIWGFALMVLGMMGAAGFYPAVADEDISIGLKQEWALPAESFDMHAYQGVAIEKIDLKDIKITLIDDDGEISKGKLDDEIWNDLAMALYEAFADELKVVVPVIEPEQDNSAQTGRLLNLNIKVSGGFEHEDLRLLMQWIKSHSKEEAKPVKLSIECEATDRQSNKPVVKLSGDADFTSADIKQPFTMPEDREHFRELAGVWARRVVNILENTGTTSKRTVKSDHSDSE